jgi:CubicO group peptidase (beta-lactamase class C family)
MFKWIALFVGTLAIILLAAGRPVMQMASGFFAKNLCSAVFVSGRDPAQVVNDDILVYQPTFLFKLLSWDIDRNAQRTRAGLGFLGRTTLASATAVHHNGSGCALYPDDVESAARLQTKPFDASLVTVPRNTESAPLEKAALSAPVEKAISAALDEAFSNPDPAHPRRTRAVVILHQGKLVAERYAPGFTEQTRFPGWSMAKSVTAALAGTLTESAALDPSAAFKLRAWPSTDPRSLTTWKQMLNMTSGLEFSEDYANPFSDVNRMLFVSSDTAAAAAEFGQRHAVNAVWSYSSGTANLVSQALREAHAAAPNFANKRYEDWPSEALFKRIGMDSAVFERDGAGLFVGSSFLFATAQDWARFGLLHLQDGRWTDRNGQSQQVLPQAWVRFVSTPTPQSKNGYGAHFWIGEPDQPNALPAGTYQATGHGGQRVTIMPKEQIVIVRLGLNLKSGQLDYPKFANQVVSALANGR